jgi:hypothetical protein
MVGNAIKSRPRPARFVRKRADTLVRTSREEYGPQFAKGYRADRTLGRVWEDTGKSLHHLVRESKK